MNLWGKVQPGFLHEKEKKGTGPAEPKSPNKMSTMLLLRKSNFSWWGEGGKASIMIIIVSSIRIFVGSSANQQRGCEAKVERVALALRAGFKMADSWRLHVL